MWAQWQSVVVPFIAQLQPSQILYEHTMVSSTFAHGNFLFDYFSAFKI